MDLHEAIKSGDKKRALELVLDTTNTNYNNYLTYRDNEGLTPLHFAIQSRSTYLTTILIGSYNLEMLNAKDNDGLTALHYTIVRELVDSILFYFDNIESSPRSIPKTKCYMAILLLISRGCDLNIKDNQGSTALDYILNKIDTYIVYACIKKSIIDVSIREQMILSIREPLETKTKDMIKLLTDNGAISSK